MKVNLNESTTNHFFLCTEIRSSISHKKGEKQNEHQNNSRSIYAVTFQAFQLHITDVPMLSCQGFCVIIPIHDTSVISSHWRYTLMTIVIAPENKTSKWNSGVKIHPKCSLKAGKHKKRNKIEMTIPQERKQRTKTSAQFKEVELK